MIPSSIGSAPRSALLPTLLSALLPALLVSGCASTSVFDREVSPRGAGAGPVQLDLVPRGAVERTFPALLAARLPTADRLATRIRAELGPSASVEVRLCVATAGDVASIAITRGSALPEFDHSVLTDARGWRFATLPGPATLRTCERATITYRPRA